jgi:hypothetical protein
VVAVPATTFVQSQPVSKSAVQAPREIMVGRPVAAAPPLAPTRKSVHGGATEGDKPPPRVFERPVLARTAPPAAHVGFEAQQPRLTVKPGKPLDDAARKDLKPTAAAPAPVVKVITPKHAAPRAVAAPPAPSPAPKAAPRARESKPSVGKPDDNKPRTRDAPQREGEGRKQKD